MNKETAETYNKVAYKLTGTNCIGQHSDDTRKIRACKAKLGNLGYSQGTTIHYNQYTDGKKDT